MNPLILNLDNLINHENPLAQEFYKKAKEYLNFIDDNNDFLSLDKFHKQWSQDIKSILENMKQLSPENKKIIAPLIMNHKKSIDEFFEWEKNNYQQQILEAFHKEPLQQEIFSHQWSFGTLHPLKESIIKLTDILISMGFTLKISPLMATEEENFDNLNFPPHHPAREMQDTFFLNNNKILRTHTSTTQIEVLKTTNVPIKIFSLGKVFRNEAIDGTHNSVFFQMEVMYINEDANVLSLRGTIEEILKKFFNEQDIKIRFRSSFFPFVCPGFEVDLWYKNKWLEIAGCGIIHENVMAHCKNNPQKYEGFAMGFGIDRLHMIKYNLNDIRSLYINQDHLYGKDHNYFANDIIKNFYKINE